MISTKCHTKKLAKIVLVPVAISGGFLLGGCGAKGGDSGVTPTASRTGSPKATKRVAKDSSVPDGWKTLTSQAGNYEVLMPVKTQNKTSDIPTKLGNLKTYMVIASLPSPDTAFIASHVDYPKQVDKLDKQKMLDDGRDGVAGKGRKLVSEKQIEMSGFPGRALVVTSKEKGQDIRMDVRMYLVNRRLYQMLVVSTNGQRAKNADVFLDSFKMIEPVEKS